jgi:hypothetical protein
MRPAATSANFTALDSDRGIVASTGDFSCDRAQHVTATNTVHVPMACSVVFLHPLMDYPLSKAIVDRQCRSNTTAYGERWVSLVRILPPLTLTLRGIPVGRDV